MIFKAITKTKYVNSNEEELFTLCGGVIKGSGNIIFTANPDFDEWSKYKDVTITYKIVNLNNQQTIDKYTYEYNYDANHTYNKDEDTFNNNIKTKKIRVLDNGTLSARINLDNKEFDSNSININRIDITKPVIKLGNYTGSKTVRSSVTIPLIVTDVGSGVNYESFTKDDIIVKVGNDIIDTYELTHGENEKYNLKINSDLYNGLVTLEVDDDKIFDNVENGNIILLPTDLLV